MLDNFYTSFKFVRHRLKKEIWKEKKKSISEVERDRERGLTGGILNFGFNYLKWKRDLRFGILDI